jgi:Rrf2 family transcriptional regulator, nitric oxide-sensitive transcriptional repressor
LQLTLHADYSLRALIYLAENPERPVSTEEISGVYQISRHHLVRVMQTLHEHQFVKLTAGRRGGATLARLPSEINIGEVVRKAEPNFRMVECFDLEANTCPIVPICRLRGILSSALESFFKILDDYTLADMVRIPPGKDLTSFLQIEPATRA